MKIIKQNPFRVLGLLGNSTERELQKQIGIIKRYAEIGKSKSFDYDLQIIGDLSRTNEDIQLAASSIEQAPKKLHYSLFWFIKNSSLDEVALNHLSQNTDKAIEIWNKALKDEVTPKNFSAYLNLSTLYLALSTIGDELSKKELQQAINLKGLLINSEGLKELSKEVTGNGISINSDDVNKLFVDEILNSLEPYLDKSNGISTNELISLFKSYPSSIQKYLASKFTEVPVSNIETSIENTISKRKSNPLDAANYGEELYKSTKSDISFLKKMLGNENVQYQMLANKLANEILQCAIDYFNFYIDSDAEFDPSQKALRIALNANEISTSGQIKTRTEDNIKILEDWVQTSEKRKAEKRINKYCWYCDKNLAENDFQYETKMYRETSRSSGPLQRKVSYQTCTIKINRCSNCYKVHKKGTKHFKWLFGTLYIISWIVFYFSGMANDDDGAAILLFITLGWIPAVIVRGIIVLIVSASNAKKFNIKMEDDIDSHPLVKERKKKKWSFKEPSA